MIDCNNERWKPEITFQYASVAAATTIREVQIHAPTHPYCTVYLHHAHCQINSVAPNNTCWTQLHSTREGVERVGAGTCIIVGIYQWVCFFYDRMTVHRNRFLVNKTNRCTEFQFYWYYGSTCFGQPFCPSSGVLSRTSALVRFMQLWWPFVTRCRMFHPTPGSKRSSQLHKTYQSRCTAKNSWWWAERLSETCRIVIPIKLEFGASVGFIHKKWVCVPVYKTLPMRVLIQDFWFPHRQCREFGSCVLLR